MESKWTLIEYRPGRFARVSHDGVVLGRASEAEVRAWFIAQGLDIKPSPEPIPLPLVDAIQRPAPETAPSSPSRDRSPAPSRESARTSPAQVIVQDQVPERETRHAAPEPVAATEEVAPEPEPAPSPGDPAPEPEAIRTPPEPVARIKDRTPELRLAPAFEAVVPEPEPAPTSPEPVALTKDQTPELGPAPAFEALVPEPEPGPIPPEPVALTKDHTPELKASPAPDTSAALAAELAAQPEPVPSPARQLADAEDLDLEMELGVEPWEELDLEMELEDEPWEELEPIAPAVGLGRMPFGTAHQSRDSDSSDALPEDAPQPATLEPDLVASSDAAERWLWVDPRERFESPSDLNGFLQRAVALFRSKSWTGGQKPTRLAAHPDDVANGLKPVAEALGLDVISDPLVPAGTYRLALPPSERDDG